MKKIFIFLLLGLFLISFASAFEFDNTYEYFEETNTAIIHNCDFWFIGCLNEGEVLANVTRTSPHNKMVARGEDQLVGEFNFTTTGDFNDVFGEMYLTDMKNGNEISRGKQYKYKKYTNISVDDYETVCDYEDVGNGTIPVNCKQEEVGSHTEIRMDWIPIQNPNNIFYSEITYEIGVFVDVEAGDWGDWRPEILGVEIEEWSQWTENLNVDIELYLKLDDNAANTNVLDSLEISNGTASTNTDNLFNTPGLINSDFLFTAASNEFVTIPDNFGFLSTGSYAFNYWIKTTQSTDGGTITLQAASNIDGFLNKDFAGKIRHRHYTGSIYDIQTADINDGDWHMITVSYNSVAQTYKVYTDNSIDGTLTSVPTSISAASSNFIGTTGGAGGYLDGELDEVSIWSRPLTDGVGGEIEDLYNSGSGITWTDQFETAPSVTLTSPADNANTTSSTQNFITTVTDDIKVDNVTLFLDGVANITNSSGFNGSYTFIVNNLAEGIHNWSILAINNQSLENQSVTRSFNFTQPPIFIDLLSPSDVSTHEIPLVNISCRAFKDDGVTQLNLTINGVVNITLVNTTVAENLTISQELNFSEDNYTWGCSAINPSTSAVSSNRTFEVLYSNPIINLFEPENAETILISNVTFIFNASDINGIDNVTLFIDGVVNETNSSGFEGNYSFFRTLADGNYNWSVVANSILGKITNSVTRIFLVHTVAPIVDISAPSGTLGYFLLGENETLVYNISEGSENSSEHFDECWFVYGEDSHCYQEFANVSTACGGLSTGGYSFEGLTDKGLMIDGDYDTFGFIGDLVSPGTIHYAYINYTKPERFNITPSWQIKDGGDGIRNITVPETCSNYNSTSVILRVGSKISPDEVHWECYNGSWQSLDISTNNRNIYEEAIFWNNGVPLNCTGNTTEFTYINGQNNLTVFAEDEFGFVASNTTTWNYSLLENSVTFSQNTSEGVEEEFKINVTFLDSFLGISILLNYAGVNYTMTSTDFGNNKEFEVDIIIPNVDVESNITFFFIALLSDASGTIAINTTPRNQTVSPFFLDDCSVQNRTLINFEMLDEDSQLEINGTIEFTINILAFDTTDIIKSFNDSYDYIIGQDSKICIGEITNNLSMSYEIRHFGDEDQYFKKYRNIQRMTINNDTIPQNITLYNLNESRGNPFNIIVVGNLLSATRNIGLLVDVQRQYLAEDQFKSIESSITDSGGIAIGHLVQSSEKYNFLISLNGELLGTFNNYKVKCANAVLDQCSITLNLASATGSTPDFETVGNITQLFLLDTDTNILHHTFISTDGLSKNIISLVIKDDGYGNTTICNNSASGTSGTILCPIPTQFQNVSIFVQTFIENQYVGSKYFSQGPNTDWQGADVLLLLLMFSSLALLFIGHPITIIIGSILGLVMPVILISVANANFGSLVIGSLFYVAAGIIAVIVIRRKKL